MIQRRHPAFNALPHDPWWPRRIKVAKDGDCVPFHFLLLWHWQFFLDGPQLPDPTIAQ